MLNLGKWIGNKKGKKKKKDTMHFDVQGIA